MKTFAYTIQDAQGIHARPAGLLVKEAAKFTSAIKLEKGGKSADAKRLFAVMGLAAKQGETLNVTVEGADEEAAATALETFLKNNL
ncbi:MAG: HPr family phosphocarrier protein [Eubacteriales bacterium]|jgi:phosphocarrier protein HPr